MVTNDVDLSNCEREKIHLLGRIQKGGGLLAFSSDLMLTHFSENLGDFIACERDPKNLLGKGIAELISSHVLSQLLDAVSLLQFPDQTERIMAMALFGGDNQFDVSLHFSGDHLVVEFEPVDGTESSQKLELLRQSLSIFSKTSSVEELCQSAASSVARITGFDRVMIYRFRDDDSGEVVAETRNGEFDSFLGMRFPASDIPSQARALYKRSLTRIITDVDQEGSLLLPQGNQLDLSISLLRAVSPIHLEYLRNMGVKASFSISILLDGKLWGLIACHNYTPKHVGIETRSYCELFVESFSLELNNRIRSKNQVITGKATQLQRLMMASLDVSETLFDNLARNIQSIKDLIDCDAMVVSMDGRYKVVGDKLSEEDIHLLLTQLNLQGSTRIFHTQHLAAWLPEGATVGERFAGLLSVPVSKRPRDQIIFLRREESKEVTWAGNPEKPVELGPNGSRLTPRKSFAAWKLLQQGISKEWTSDEIGIAKSLKEVLLELLVRNLDELNRITQEAHQQQDILIHELNHRVRNMLGLINSIISQTKSDDSIDVFKGILEGRIKALASAQTVLTDRNWDAPPIKLIFDNEMDAFVDDPSKITLNGIELLLSPKAFTSLTLVVHELLTNAVKYGALSQSGGAINVDWHLDQYGDMHLNWKESGITIDENPIRVGFGSTIIQRTVPYDLGGEAKVLFKRSGLQAKFVIPSKFIGKNGNAEVGCHDVESNEIGENHALTNQTAGQRALVVEDNMLIAIDVEQTLYSYGFEKVELARSVSSALDLIEANEFNFAVLDVNLGQETSEAVALKLQKLSIPFIFATGYRESYSDLSDRFNSVKFLAKPFSQRELIDCIHQG